MSNVLKSSIFKLLRDRTFHVTLIVGGILAVLISLIYFIIDLSLSTQTNGPIHAMATGSNMLLNSVSPVQNFGIAIPINLINIIVAEFTYGTIRNKVIVGYRKTQIYFGLFIVGLIFSLTLAFFYVGFSVALGCIFGGFNPSGSYTSLVRNLSGAAIAEYIGMAICVYIFITSLALFFATVFRHVGGAITVNILVLIFFMILPIIFLATFSSDEEVRNAANAVKWFDPIFYQSITVNLALASLVAFDQDANFVAGIISPLIYAAIFFFLGMYIFAHRDLK
ncbi:MAG: ABC transporter permease subunit [Bacilli bacterium]|nr:ABC transporter permease subunit [Bacilli bacterium]